MGGLRLIPLGLELLIFPAMISALKGRNTTIRNSTDEKLSFMISSLQTGYLPLTLTIPVP